MTFYHHWSGGGGNFTHTSDHGVFLDLENACEFAAMLIARETSTEPISFEEAGFTDDDILEDRFSNWNNKQITIVDRDGKILFSNFLCWEADDAARMVSLCSHYAGKKAIMAECHKSERK